MPQATHCKFCPDPLGTDIERAYGEHVDCDPPRSESKTAVPAKPAQATAVLDWSGKDGGLKAGVGDLKKCVACSDLTILRHPDTGLPHHKTCAEKALNRVKPVSPVSSSTT